jgi:hypothetical protein
MREMRRVVHAPQTRNGGSRAVSSRLMNEARDGCASLRGHLENAP